MNASTRWATHFVEALECVKCRTKEHLRLLYFNGKLVEPETLTIEQLHAIIPKMDAWCESCVPVGKYPRVNMWVAGPGRLGNKQEASFIADVRANLLVESAYDLYLLDNGVSITKHQVYEHVKNRPCALCKQQFNPVVMDFYHVDGQKHTAVSRMVKSTYSLREMLNEIQKCALLCANCHRLVTLTKTKYSLETIVLDENFFNSIDLSKEKR